MQQFACQPSGTENSPCFLNYGKNLRELCDIVSQVGSLCRHSVIPGRLQKQENPAG